MGSGADPGQQKTAAVGIDPGGPKAGDGIRTHDIHVGNVTLYH